MHISYKVVKNVYEPENVEQFPVNSQKLCV